jgi:ABC-type transporter Mla subunit MlaD
MKSKNSSHYLIALGVIVCSLALLAALTFALAGYSWPAGGRKLAIEFHDATGIRLNSAVRFAGKTAGRVAEIRYLGAEERRKARDGRNAVRVTVQLDDEVPPLLEETSATITAETLLGEKFVALTPGRPEARPLPEGAILQGVEVFSIDAVARSAQTAIENVNEIITSLKADYPALVPRLAELLTQGNSILAQGGNLVNNADQAILNANGAVTRLKTDYAELVPKLMDLFDHAQSIATNANHAIQRVDALADRVDGVVKNNEGDLGKILAELRVSSQNLKVITTYAKALSSMLAEKPSSLIWGRKKTVLPNEQEILDSREPWALGNPNP